MHRITGSSRPQDALNPEGPDPKEPAAEAAHVQTQRKLENIVLGSGFVGTDMDPSYRIHNVFVG
jgi:hypothetical protein